MFKSRDFYKLTLCLSSLSVWKLTVLCNVKQNYQNLEGAIRSEGFQNGNQNSLSQTPQNFNFMKENWAFCKSPSFLNQLGKYLEGNLRSKIVLINYSLALLLLCRLLLTTEHSACTIMARSTQKYFFYPMAIDRYSFIKKINKGSSSQPKRFSIRYMIYQWLYIFQNYDIWVVIKYFMECQPHILFSNSKNSSAF